MHDRRRQDRLYTAILMAFLIGLVALGLLGVPALLVAAIGVAVGALGLAVFRRSLEGRGGSAARPRAKGGDRVPARYVPSVLEPTTLRRRRGLHLRGHRHA